MGRFSLWFGHGDNDPHGLELNDGLRYHVLSVDEGKPDEQIDQREIIVHVLTQASTVAMARRQISELARLIMRAAQRNAGTVEPTTLRVSGPELRTMWWDVLSVDTDEGADGFDASLRSAYATLQVTFVCRAYGRTEPVTLVEGAIVEPTDPVLVLPPVDTDAPAELEVDIDDLTRGGTGANRWRLASMPLGPDGEVPALSLDCTDPETPAPEMETLSGNMPPATVVRQDWQTLATGEMTWPDDTPPPQHVELFARVADLDPVGAPIEQMAATAVDGPLRYVPVAASGNTAVFNAIPANSMLVVVARAKTASPMTWPAGWTVQTSASAEGYRLELATRAITTNTASASVTVTASGATVTLNAWMVPGATSVIGAVSRNSPGTLTLPGDQGYHATIAVAFAGFRFETARSVQNLRQPSTPFPLPGEEPYTGRLTLQGLTSTYAFSSSVNHPIREIDHNVYTAIGTAAPGTLSFAPKTFASFESLDVEVQDPVTGAVGPLRVIDTTPAKFGIIVAVVLGTNATAPNVPGGTYRVGATGVLSDGRETPLLTTASVRTTGLRPIAASWVARLTTLAGVVQWRLYYQRQNETWRYITVSANTFTATITDVTAGTKGDPPQAVAMTGAEIRALLRSGPGAAREVELPPASCRVGLGQWELVPLGVLPPTLIPGGNARLHIEIQARTGIGVRTVALDRVLFLPVSQDLGGMVADVLDTARSVPMRWRHHIDPDGRHSMRLWGTLGHVVADDGMLLGPLATGDPDDPEWTALRLRVADPNSTITNLMPTYPPDGSGPAWMGAVAPTGESDIVNRPGLPMDDAEDDAFPGDIDTFVLRARATGTISPAIPVTPSTTYTASGYARIPTGGNAATVHFRIVWYQGDDATVLGANDGTTITTTGEWQLITVTGTAPTGATHARVHLVWDNGTADVWLDAVQFETGTRRTVYARRVENSPNLLTNASLTAGPYSWQIWGGVQWNSGQLTYSQGADPGGAATDPILVQPGMTYTFSFSEPVVGITGRFRWFDANGTHIRDNSTAGSAIGGRRVYTVTAPSNAASLQFSFAVSGDSRSMSAPRLCVGEETSYVATNHTAVESPSNCGPLALPYPAALDPLDPARGWLAVRFRSFAGTATVWEWRADDDNALALTVTPTDIVFTRTTDGADDTVTVPRPAGQYNDGSDELVAFATWDEGQLTLRIHDGTDWGAVQTTTSTDWPDLRGADWHLGARWKDNGTQDQYLWGHLVWCVVGTNPDAIDPTAIPARTSEEPTPNDIPGVAGLAWLWATTNPGRLIVWREGGYATVAGEVTAWDRPTALVIIGEDAARGHHIGPARVTVRAIPRLRYLGGA